TRPERQPRRGLDSAKTLEVRPPVTHLERPPLGEVEGPQARVGEDQRTGIHGGQTLDGLPAPLPRGLEIRHELRQRLAPFGPYPLRRLRRTGRHGEGS